MLLRLYPMLNTNGFFRYRSRIASNFSSNVLLRIWTVSVVSNFVGSLQYLNHLYTNKKWHVKQERIQIAEPLAQKEKGGLHDIEEAPVKTY